MLGKIISHYEITGSLGTGGMGEVYAARDTLLGRKVAIKVLHEGMAMEEPRLRFIQEARAASALNHPNIVTIYDVVRDGDCDLIVMELVGGETLDARIARGPLPFGEALDILDAIAGALAAAHARGILHRDLKPANVMLTPGGGLKILDFGLAKMLEPGDDLQPAYRTASGFVVGTPAYMSPEQARGHPLDRRSDLFSLGSIGMELITGTNPFEADTALGTMQRIASGEPPSFEGLPEAAVPMFQRLLARNKEERYATADELRGAIAEVRAAVRPPAPEPERTPLWRRALNGFLPRK